jgi:hypothetical protein
MAFPYYMLPHNLWAYDKDKTIPPLDYVHTCRYREIPSFYALLYTTHSHPLNPLVVAAASVTVTAITEITQEEAKVGKGKKERTLSLFFSHLSKKKKEI